MFHDWPGLDPARHPFDPAAARDVIREIAPPVPPRPASPGDLRYAEARVAGATS
jgi:hypothetical protein